MRFSGYSLPRRQFPLDALPLDRASDVPLHRQLYLALRALILRRTLAPSTALPSIRALAQDLALSRNTVIAAYEQLASEGYIETRHGARSLVADLGAAPRSAPTAPEPAAVAGKLSQRGRLMLAQPRQRSFPGRAAFHPGTPDVRHFPFAAWRRLIVRHLGGSGEDLFGYHHLAGHPRLKEAIAAYLAASRGVHCEPQQIVVTTGAQAALDLIARLILDPGDAVWMEEPGFLGAQSAFLAAGAELLPLAVDEAGWTLDLPEAPRLKAVYVTPSCHSPLGITMRMDQRLRLLEMAQARDLWIIEDDFDSEYRFVGRPIPAMQGADVAGRTIYIGTFAKTLFPALRIGFMVLPQELAASMTRAINVSGQYPPLGLQAALADFLDRGLFTQHLRRMRRLYARRRERFIALGTEHLGRWLTAAPGDAGIQSLWWLDPAIADVELSARAEARGINVAPLSRHYRHGAPRNGLILGYAALDEAATLAGMHTLAEVLRASA